tara:strand:+ start:919 stop:1158 length:240 start_codon:yes stop_codon:yes gene_type:complete
MHTHTKSIQRETSPEKFIDLIMEIDFSVSKTREATYWQPAEGGEIEIEEIRLTDEDGQEFEPLPEETNGIEEECWEVFN